MLRVQQNSDCNIQWCQTKLPKIFEIAFILNDILYDCAGWEVGEVYLLVGLVRLLRGNTLI